MGFESIVQRVKSIPTLPESVRKVEELYLQNEPDLKELVKIIENDPALTANILATVNSPLYSFSKNIVSIHQAITLFGMSVVRGFVLSSLSTKSFDFDMSPYNVTNNEYKNISLLQSTLMFQWFMSVDIHKANILIPIAFLMDIGKIIIANEVAQSDYLEMFKNILQESETITEVEKIFTDMSSAEVTGLLFEHWNFNDTFINILKYSDRPDDADDEFRTFCQAIDVVKTCINIKEPLTDRSIEAAKKKVIKYGFPLDAFIRRVKKLQEKL